MICRDKNTPKKLCILSSVHLYASLDSRDNQLNCSGLISVMQKHLVFSEVGGMLNNIYETALSAWIVLLTTTQRTRNCRLPSVLKTFYLTTRRGKRQAKAVIVSLSTLRSLLFMNQQSWTVSMVHVLCLQLLSGNWLWNSVKVCHRTTELPDRRHVYRNVKPSPRVLKQKP